MTPIPYPIRLAMLLPLLAVTAPATAQEAREGFYAKIYGGYSTLLDDTVSRNGGRSAVDYDGGLVTGGAVGYTYPGTNFASEIEYTYRSGDASGFDAGFATEGDFASTSVMVNGYYRFDPVGGGRFRPYIGAGLGYVTEIDFDLEGTGAAIGEYTDRGGVAFQVMGGAEYDLASRWSVNAEIRYFNAGSPGLTGPGGMVEGDYQTIEVIAGVSFRF